MGQFKHSIAGRLRIMANAIDPPLPPPSPPPTQRELALEQWLRDEGEKTLRLHYDLGPESTVVDIGGYEGQWASDIYAMYRCRILVFEPVTAYTEATTRRFAHNDAIRVFPYGLAASTAHGEITVNGDASSLYNHGETRETIELMDVVECLRDDLGLNEIDLMKINIEGAEYDLLDRVLGEKYHLAIRNIQVQFHDFVENANQRRQEIRRRLSETHELTYEYYFVWENWRRRD
ncbi:MAG: FkbM family methyltransferase [Planctomycetes bacterium]|nr:FkbM family methyltransferase [Planctomycetota bacterium]